MFVMVLDHDGSKEGRVVTQPAPPSGGGQFVQANGLDIYYEEHGRGEEPLILVHGGLITGMANWGPSIPDFEEHFRIIVPDSRGHGRTENPTGEFSYRLMAEDVAAFARALGLDAPLICGYSDGGNVAVEVGMRFPDLPKALAVGAAWHELSEAYLEGVRSTLHMDGEGEADPDRMEQENPQFAEFLRREQQAQGPDHWKRLVKQLGSMWTTPLEYSPEDFQRIEVPTLVWVGNRDQLVRVEEAVRMYRMLPDAELYVAPNRDHFSGLGALRFPLTDFLMRQIT
jgi:pimeloyl-ACP methyl ester carboxylesterase